MDTTMTDPLVGRLLDDRYQVDVRIARGGMASVYLATDTRLERRVAVKVMHPALADDEAFVARFIREAKAAAALSHPNVVAVFDQGADGETVFLVMEYVHGRTLRDLLRQQKRLSPAQAVTVMEPVLAALGAAHRAGLVHRDVKPENVLIADDGQVKVADFGLARAIAEAHLTASSTVLIGTASYLAPEQVSRGIADARADVYAAGIMFYELLTGRPPFQGDTPLAVAYQHVHEQVPAPSAEATAVPAALDALVRRATAQDPDDRPADAGTLLAELRAVRSDLGLRDELPLPAAGGPTQVTQVIAGLTTPIPPSTTDPGSVRRRRRRWPWVAALLAIVTAAAAVGGWWLASGRYVDAPKLVGLSVAQAKAAATGHGLHVKVGDGVYDDHYAEGLVATQDPAPNHRLRDGGTVTLHPSLGPTNRPVPGVIHAKLDAAKAEIQKARLKPVVGDGVYNETVPAGYVVTTDPPPGKIVPHDTKVTLIPSKGPPPVTVPSVQGMKLDRAKRILTDAGLTSTVTEQFSDTVAANEVISQDPAGGSVPKGSAIALVVSKGPQLFTGAQGRGQEGRRRHARSSRRPASRSSLHQVLPAGPNKVLPREPGGRQQAAQGHHHHALLLLTRTIVLRAPSQALARRCARLRRRGSGVLGSSLCPVGRRRGGAGLPVQPPRLGRLPR